MNVSLSAVQLPKLIQFFFGEMCNAMNVCIAKIQITQTRPSRGRTNANECHLSDVFSRFTLQCQRRSPVAENNAKFSAFKIQLCLRRFWTKIFNVKFLFLLIESYSKYFYIHCHRCSAQKWISVVVRCWDGWKFVHLFLEYEKFVQFSFSESSSISRKFRSAFDFIFPSHLPPPSYEIIHLAMYK